MIENTTMMMACISLLVLAAKKNEPKRLFGQMTLGTNSLALEYLKTSAKPIARKVKKIEWLLCIEAKRQGYAMPQWVVENPDKYQWCCILFDESRGTLPLLVYQASALRELEKHFAKLEDEGASVIQSQRGITIDMGDGCLTVSFFRNEKGGRFAPFHVDFE